MNFKIVFDLCGVANDFFWRKYQSHRSLRNDVNNLGTKFLSACYLERLMNSFLIPALFAESGTQRSVRLHLFREIWIASLVQSAK